MYKDVLPKGFGGDRKAPKTRTRHLMFKPPFHRRLEAAGVTTGQGKPSLTGLSLLKNSPQDCFSIHLLPCA